MTTILQEHGPKELFKAYENSSDVGIDKYAWDLEHSKFQELTKKEALKFLTHGEADKLQLVIEGKLVLLTPNGACSPKTDITLSNEDNWYTRPSGVVTNQTGLIPGAHLIKIADKIYAVELVPHDYDKAMARDAYTSAVDSAMRNFRNSFAAKTSPTAPRGTDLHAAGLTGVNSHALDNLSTDKIIDTQSKHQDQIERLEYAIKKYKKLARQALADIEQYTSAGDTAAVMLGYSKVRDYAKKIKDLEQQLDDYEKNVDSEKWIVKDSKAAIRNALSMKNLQDKITSKQVQLARLSELEKERKELEQDIKEVKTNGSQQTRKLRSDVDYITNLIRDTKKEIAALELYLEDTSDDDKEALMTAQEEYNDLVKQLGDVQGVVDKMAAIRAKRGG